LPDPPRKRLAGVVALIVATPELIVAERTPLARSIALSTSVTVAVDVVELAPM